MGVYAGMKYYLGAESTGEHSLSVGGGAQRVGGPKKLFNFIF